MNNIVCNPNNIVNSIVLLHCNNVMFFLVIVTMLKFGFSIVVFIVHCSLFIAHCHCKGTMYNIVGGLIFRCSISITPAYCTRLCKFGQNLSPRDWENIFGRIHRLDRCTVGASSMQNTGCFDPRRVPAHPDLLHSDKNIETL